MPGEEGWFEKIVALKYFQCVRAKRRSQRRHAQRGAQKLFAGDADRGRIRLFKSYRLEYKDGEQCRDFLYSKDAALMTLHLAANRQAVGIFNIGSGQAHTWNQLANAIFSAVGASRGSTTWRCPNRFATDINTSRKPRLKSCEPRTLRGQLLPWPMPCAITCGTISLQGSRWAKHHARPAAAKARRCVIGR